MDEKIRIIVSARMGYGTFEAKMNPLSQIYRIEQIYVLRKEKGPVIDKVTYLLLPRICKYKFFNLMLTPIYLIYYTLLYRPAFLLSYHFLPHAFFVWIAGFLTNTPYIVSQTGLVIHEKANKYPLKIFLKIILKHAKYVNVPGSYSKKKWIEFGVYPHKVNILHSTIDTTRFYPENKRKEYDFIFVGVFYEVKRIDWIIKAFSRLKSENDHPRLLLVGDGILMDSFRKLVSELKIENRVKFAGFRKDTEKYLNLSKIFVMASKTEGLPCALMEAMSCELTVVVPDVGNISDLVSSEYNGYLIDDLSINKLENAMARALANYTNHIEISRKARETIVHKHSYSFATSSWLEILRGF